MNSKWSQYHKKKEKIKHTIKQTNKKNDREIYQSKVKLRLLFLHIFHTSFTFRHKHRFTKSKMKKKPLEEQFQNPTEKS